MVTRRLVLLVEQREGFCRFFKALLDGATKETGQCSDFGVSRRTRGGQAIAAQMIACGGKDDARTDEDGAVGHAEGGVSGRLGCEGEHGFVLSHFGSFMMGEFLWVGFMYQIESFTEICFREGSFAKGFEAR